MFPNFMNFFYDVQDPNFLYQDTTLSRSCIIQNPEGAPLYALFNESIANYYKRKVFHHSFHLLTGSLFIAFSAGLN